MKAFLTFISFYLIIFSKVSSQEAFYPIVNYTTKEYGKEFNPANRAILQDKRGIIYAANGFKLLEYDGNAWNSYPINREAWILSLAIDSSGTIYAGSQNEFGLFKPDKRGELKYWSLSDSLDIMDADFSNVWKVHSCSEGVVFQAEESLFIFKNGKIEVVRPETSFHTSFTVNNKVFVRERNKGLMELNGDKLIRVTGSEIFDTTGIFMMVPLGGKMNDILIATQEKGFWLFEPEKKSNPFRKFIVDDQELLEKAKITGGIITGDGSIAISTMLNGIVIIDTTGKTKAIINNKKGLIDNDVKQVIMDHSQNIWLALNNGISHIEISSPLSISTEKSGLIGNINTLTRFNELLFAGTSAGLFVEQAGNKTGITFKPAFNISVPVWSLLATSGYLFAGTDDGLYEIKNNKSERIGTEASFTLYYTPDMNLLFSGGPKGLTTYQLNGSIRRIESIKIAGQDIIGISNEKNRSSDADEFWLGTRYNGVIRIKINEDLTCTTENYNVADGLPDGWIIPYVLNSNTLFGTIRGLYRFTSELIVNESLPDSLKDDPVFSKGYFSELTDSIFSSVESVTYVAENTNKIWLCSDNTIGYLNKRDNMAMVNKPFKGIEVGKINVIYPEENGICWIGTTDGLIRYDENIRKNYDKEFLGLIRRVTITDTDSVIFMGTKKHSTYREPLLSYRNNSIRFEFSAPFYEYSDKNLYSYKLNGPDSKWSMWTKEPFQEYTDLHEGSYSFIVKAKNIYGNESIPDEFGFIIHPPWYRSLIAYAGYIIISLILFWLFARLYSYRLKRENIRLEGIVTERTAEVTMQKDEILSKNTILENQKKEIEDSIRYASRIQSAVIPSEEACVNLLTESFVFFQPLNIVSGDFYWISQVDNKIIFTAADCTGHGVPGAFMSMLGVAFLNEIVNKDKITSPDIVLNQLRGKVIQALQQHGISGEARDGMDIAIICLDKNEKKLSYAGAYNPLIMIRNGEIIETSGDKMPIGIYENMPPFKKHDITIERGDVFYMSSDGYEDQFGGPDGKKFKSKRFKQLLLEIHKQSMEKQKIILKEKFEEWKGDLPQLDDVVVVGTAINW